LTLTGDYSGQRWKLGPWQRDWISELYGSRNPDGTRAKTKVSLWLPRGGAKTTQAAGIGVYELLFGPPGREIYSAGPTLEKAELLFKTAAQMIRANKYLSSRVDISDHYRRIKVIGKNSTFRSLAADTDRGHGFAPSTLILDEVHLWKSREMYDSLITGFGKRKKGSRLEIQISTAGKSKTGLAWDLYTYAKNVRDKVVTDPETVVRIFEAADEDDWTDPKVWRKAMPFTFVDMEFIASEFKLAQVIKHKEFAFRQLYLNQWIEHSDETWISPEDWKACQEDYFEEDLLGEEAYAGLDLSSVRDLTSLSLFFPASNRVLSWSWLPSEGLADREEKDGVTYRKWKKEGHLFTTTGSRIVHSEVATKINEICQQFNVIKFVADPYSLHLIAPYLNQEPDKYPQSPGYMSPPAKWLETAIAERKVKSDGNPLLSWCMGNVVVEKDKYENISPHKHKSRKRIDPVIALVMAIGAWLGTQGDEITTEEFYKEKSNFAF
jgi:phage terminase large subunit-like protein